LKTCGSRNSAAALMSQATRMRIGNLLFARAARSRRGRARRAACRAACRRDARSAGGVRRRPRRRQ
jgi:hypothetical protein